MMCCVAQIHGQVGARCCGSILLAMVCIDRRNATFFLPLSGRAMGSSWFFADFQGLTSVIRPLGKHHFPYTISLSSPVTVLDIS